MASQNRDPAATSVAAARKGAEPSGGAARGPVGKRLQQELMTLMGSIRTSSTVCLLSTPRETQDHPLPLPCNLGVCQDSPGSACSTSLTFSFSPPIEPNIDSPLNTHAAELWKNPTAFKKYLQETYSKQVTSQEP
uniref:Ubiquitin conjugating enzyme E2 C n=1 Tax=Aotus nancymaae TaxID=37293 RepID=A0A2K5CTI6_AOTNA